ncbi:MAG: DNA integrity scanning protein DisA nucleotide-binding domain protein [Thermoleophilia bacterium]|nr:DNA integrity scanning protein DisA nucleotide-binding domain protein [Thermoleophilia bacterium]
MAAPVPNLDVLFGPVAEVTRCSDASRHALAEVVELGVELAREGREGHKIGTMFVVGDADEVLARSRPLLLDPLHGHPRELLDVSKPEFRENVKELAQLDGAFVVDDMGTFVAACRFVEVDVAAPANFMPGLGTRHAAAASITRETKAIAVVVSQSAIVRVYAGGEIRAEIIPELFLLTREQLFARDPAVTRVPEAGITLALAGVESAGPDGR